jgi:hypothetical protein
VRPRSAFDGSGGCSWCSAAGWPAPHLSDGAVDAHHRKRLEGRQRQRQRRGGPWRSGPRCPDLHTHGDATTLAGMLSAGGEANHSGWTTASCLG